MRRGNLTSIMLIEQQMAQESGWWCQRDKKRIDDAKQEGSPQITPDFDKLLRYDAELVDRQQEAKKDSVKDETHSQALLKCLQMKPRAERLQKCGVVAPLLLRPHRVHEHRNRLLRRARQQRERRGFSE